MLADKQHSPKENSPQEFGELSDMELVQERFDGKELELIALAIENLILRVARQAWAWVKEKRQKLEELRVRPKMTPVPVG